MRMQRTFWPVGQGAFYSEVFRDRAVVHGIVLFDCGTKSDQSFLLKAINKLQNQGQGKAVDILFISHFHRDHISQITSLLNNWDVRLIVLPVIDFEAVMDAYLDIYTDTNRLDCPELDLLEKLVSGTEKIGETKVIRIRPIPEGSGKEVTHDTPYQLIDTDSIKKLASVEELESDTRFLFNQWEYIPCNYPCAKATSLVQEIQKKHPDLYDAYRIMNWDAVRVALKTIRFDDIKRLYSASYKKTQNEESMTVLSRPVKTLDPHTAHCLYTGDSPFRSDKRLAFVKNYYKIYWDKIGTIQSPHHGSEVDNPKELYDQSRTCTVCFATTNHHGHPGRQALINMASAKSVVRLVTEEERSLFSQSFQF